jgi:hypothetical protein
MITAQAPPDDQAPSRPLERLTPRRPFKRFAAHALAMYCGCCLGWYIELNTIFVATCAGSQVLAYTSTKEEGSLLLLRRVLMLMSLTSFILCVVMAASSIQHVSSCTTLVKMTMNEGRRGVIQDVSVARELWLCGCDAGAGIRYSVGVSRSSTFRPQ